MLNRFSVEISATVRWAVGPAVSPERKKRVEHENRDEHEHCTGDGKAYTFLSPLLSRLCVYLDGASAQAAAIVYHDPLRPPIPQLKSVHLAHPSPLQDPHRRNSDTTNQQ